MSVWKTAFLMSFVAVANFTIAKIKEYADLEGTHEDYQVQLLALHKTPQESPQICLCFSNT